MIRYNECYVNNDNDLKIIIKGNQESKKVKAQKVGYAPGFELKNDSSPQLDCAPLPLVHNLPVKPLRPTI
jgi:hypothetical protein